MNIDSEPDTGILTAGENIQLTPKPEAARLSSCTGYLDATALTAVAV